MLSAFTMIYIETRFVPL